MFGELPLLPLHATLQRLVAILWPSPLAVLSVLLHQHSSPYSTPEYENPFWEQVFAHCMGVLVVDVNFVVKSLAAPSWTQVALSDQLGGSVGGGVVVTALAKRGPIALPPPHRCPASPEQGILQCEVGSML